MTLEIIVTWSDPLIKFEILHQKLLQRFQEDSTRTFTIHHTAVLGLKDALKSKRLRKNSNVISAAHTLLPFADQTQIDQKSSYNSNLLELKMVYVELRGIAESYATNHLYARINSGALWVIQACVWQKKKWSIPNTRWKRINGILCNSRLM